MAVIERDPPAKGIRLNLATLEACRKSYTRIIRMMARREIDREDFRALSYGLNGVLQFFKTEKEAEIEARLEAIEQALKGRA